MKISETILLGEKFQNSHLPFRPLVHGTRIRGTLGKQKIVNKNLPSLSPAVKFFGLAQSW
jgi:hypothetical protein